MEMSFVEEEDVFDVWERVLAETFREVAWASSSRLPFPRMRYDEAMERFGVDKPDLRFGLELVGVDEWAASVRVPGLPRRASQRGGRVMGLGVPARARALAQGRSPALEEHRQGLRREGPGLVEGRRPRAAAAAGALRRRRPRRARR